LKLELILTTNFILNLFRFKLQLLGHGLDTGVQLWAGAMMGFFLFAAASRLALELTHPPIQRVLGAVTPWVKRLEREVFQSPPLVQRLIMSGATPPLPSTSSWHGAQLCKGYVFMA